MKQKFEVGERVLWITKDFEGRHCTKAIISEVHTDHVLARTAENGNNSDDLTLWIDKDNEMDFFKITGF